MRDSLIDTLIHGFAPINTLISGGKPLKLSTQQLLNLPDGTLGKETAILLKESKFELIPSYESHDFKHVLLNYPMTGLGEVRMQFFALGNGNYYPPTWGIVALGLLLFPRNYKLFIEDYRRGKRACSITNLAYENLMYMNLEQLKNWLIESKGLKG